MRMNFFGNDDDEEDEEENGRAKLNFGQGGGKSRGKRGGGIGSGFDLDFTLNDKYHDTEEGVTGGKNGSTPDKVDRNIVSELLIEELPEWRVGVTTIRVNEQGNIVVIGENNHVVEEVRVGRNPDIDAVTRKVNKAIQYEHNQL